MKIEIEVPDNRIADMLCGAFEGGSNYWAAIARYNPPAPAKLWKWETPITADGSVFKHIQYPLSEGGAVIVIDNESDDPQEFVLDLEHIRAGLKAFADLKPGEGGHHFGDFLSENDDATTADVFLQCCLFGEVIYG